MPYFGDPGGTFGDPGGTFGDKTPTDPWFPDITIEAAFDANVYDDPADDAWTDLTDYGIRLDITRGRTSELEDYQPATATITFDDPDRVFDFEHTSSPFHGRLLPRVQIRATATWDSVTYPLFRGYVDVWGPFDTSMHEWSSISIPCYDASAILAGRRVVPARPFTIGHPVLGKLDGTAVFGGPLTLPVQREGQRIRQILKYIGWPAALTDVDDGRTALIVDTIPEDGKVWPYLQRCARSGGGSLYVEADGKITYRQRRAWTRVETQRTSQATFSDVITDDKLTCIELKVSPPAIARVKNRVVRARDGGTEWVATDPSSVDKYDVAEDSQTDLLSLHDSELIAQAKDTLGRYREPTARVEAITIAPEQNTLLMWPQALGRTLGDRLTIERTPVAGDALAITDCRIEQIATTVDASTLEWRTTWALSPADLRRVFTIGDPDLGRLDDPTITFGY